jgi:serine/threonine protein kinase
MSQDEGQSGIGEIARWLLGLPADEQRRRIDEMCDGKPELRPQLAAAMAALDGKDGGETRSDAQEPATDKESFSPPMPALPLQTRYGPYTIERELGKGGFGRVFRATDARDGRRAVALKVLLGDKLSDAGEAIFFRREVTVLRSLLHPGIAEFLDAGITREGDRYVAMELVDGIPLLEFCDTNRLSVAERLAIFLEVCDAIRYAHNRGIVHRDLKPMNILVAAGRRAKIVDFGLAAFTDPQREAREELRTISGWRPLTPAYASPELLRGQFTKDCRVDVYALGVILYELLVGCRPLKVGRDEVFEELASRIESSRPVLPSEQVSSVHSGQRADEATTVTPAELRSTSVGHLRRALAGDLDQIVLMAMRPQAERRYQQVGDLIDDLQRHLRGDPVRARPDSLLYRTSRFARRNAAWVAAAGAAVLAIMSLLAGAVVAERTRLRVAEESLRSYQEYFTELAKQSGELRSDPATRALVAASAAAATANPDLARQVNSVDLCRLLTVHLRLVADGLPDATELLTAWEQGNFAIELWSALPVEPDQAVQRQIDLADCHIARSTVALGLHHLLELRAPPPADARRAWLVAAAQASDAALSHARSAVRTEGGSLSARISHVKACIQGADVLHRERSDPADDPLKARAMKREAEAMKRRAEAMTRMAAALGELEARCTDEVAAANAQARPPDGERLVLIPLVAQGLQRVAFQGDSPPEGKHALYEQAAALLDRSLESGVPSVREQDLRFRAHWLALTSALKVAPAMLDVAQQHMEALESLHATVGRPPSEWEDHFTKLLLLCEARFLLANERGDSAAALHALIEACEVCEELSAALGEPRSKDLIQQIKDVKALMVELRMECAAATSLGEGAIR